MGKVYDSMANTFVQQGLNLDAIAATRQFYGLTPDNATDSPQPLYYSSFPTPLEKGAVRLVIFLLAAAPELHSAATEAAHAITAAIPTGRQQGMCSCLGALRLQGAAGDAAHPRWLCWG